MPAEERLDSYINFCSKVSGTVGNDLGVRVRNHVPYALCSSSWAFRLCFSHSQLEMLDKTVSTVDDRPLSFLYTGSIPSLWYVQSCR